MRIRFSLKNEVAFGFAIAFTILSAIGWASYKSIGNLIQTQESVSHTQDIIHLSNRLLSEVEAAGSEQHLYIITGQEEFPESYLRFKRQIARTLTELNPLLVTNLSQQKRFITAELFTEERLKIADILIQVRKKYGFRAAQTIIKAGRTAGITNMIRKSLDAIKKWQRALLAQRIHEAEKSATNTVWIIALATATALILLSMAAWIIYQDIDNQKQVERMKDEVIAMATHEMRNPLTAIHASLSVLIDGIKPSANVEKLISIAHQSSSHLIKLVDDFLDIQKLEYGRMEFHVMAVDLEPLLRKAIELNQTYAEKLGVKLSVKEYIPRTRINADEGRFLQVMANLISNAAKYSPQGEIVEVAATHLGKLVRVSIIDHGQGIPENFKDRIFQKFSQADCAVKPGTGLGLSISKAIIEKLGGIIGFEPTPGHGTTFYFDLPRLSSDDKTSQI
jgi:signal transduction histidine kinase